MNTTPLVCVVHTKQTVYELKHISSPPSFLLSILGWDCRSVVDGVPGPGSDLSAAKMLGVAFGKVQCPLARSRQGPGTADPRTTLLCAMLQILKCEAHSRVHSVWGSLLLGLFLKTLEEAHSQSITHSLQRENKRHV